MVVWLWVLVIGFVVLVDGMIGGVVVCCVGCWFCGMFGGMVGGFCGVLFVLWRLLFGGGNQHKAQRRSPELH
jgi:hypothetical protein